MIHNHQVGIFSKESCRDNVPDSEFLLNVIQVKQFFSEGNDSL